MPRKYDAKTDMGQKRVTESGHFGMEKEHLERQKEHFTHQKGTFSTSKRASYF